MTHQRIRPGGNQLVTSLQRDNTAPIASESEPRPDTKDQSSDAQHGADPRQRIKVWNDAMVERIGQAMAFRKQEPAEQQRYDITQSLQSAFLIDGLLGRERGQ